MKRPNKGYHDLYCIFCGKLFVRAVHRNGKNKLTWCVTCMQQDNYCLDCYYKHFDFEDYETKE